MKKVEKQKAVLLLDDGTFLEGTAVGYRGTTTGEVCFNTGMTGYQEMFTDPSYLKQILVMASPHIGNYGVIPSEVESDGVKIAGLVCKSFSSHFSRHGDVVSLQDYLELNRLVGISDIDTRFLVRKIRESGSMNAIISSVIFDQEELFSLLKAVPSMTGQELSSFVSSGEVVAYGNAEAKYKVALLDFGVKQNIIRCLTERNCLVKVFPMTATISEIKAWNPSGLMISNGPGDPFAMPETVKLLQELIAINLPIFGICLGHQLLALACGMKTFKMKRGHRGVNHPIKNLLTGCSEITTQNHGFCVDLSDAEKNTAIQITHIHLNDGTLAGFKIRDKKVFSVQYHPEAFPGPHDSRYLFDQFIENMNII